MLLHSMVPARRLCGCAVKYIRALIQLEDSLPKKEKKEGGMMMKEYIIF